MHWGKQPSATFFFVCADPATVCLRYTSLLHVPEGVLLMILPPLHLSVRCPFLCPGSCIPHYPLELTTFKRNSSPLTVLVLPNFGVLVLYFTIVISRVQKNALPLRKTRMRNARYKYMYWTGYQRGVRRAWVAELPLSSRVSSFLSCIAYLIPRVS